MNADLSPKLPKHVRRLCALVACASAACVGACSLSNPSSETARPGTPVVAMTDDAVGEPSQASAGSTAARMDPVLLQPTTPVTTAATQSPTAMQSTTISRDPITLDDCGATNPADLAPDVVAQLKAGGDPGATRWLYPYEGTVFPRGMLAPDLMWAGPAADAVYVHIKSNIFEYRGCLTPNADGQVTLDQSVWDQAGQRSFGRDDSYTIELTLWSQGAAVGPVTLHIQIAQAAIKGSIYYNSYASKLAPATAGLDPTGLGAFGLPGGGLGGGVVLRIPPGGSAEVFGQTDCNGCHSVSADGSRLVAQSVMAGAYSYGLVANGPAPTPAMPGINGCWAALYPDGSAYLNMSSVIDVARAGLFGASSGAPQEATLYDSQTGAIIASTGIPKGALMPFFSPDGTRLTFNDYAIEEAHGIALVRYDTMLHAATDYDVLYTEPAGAIRPGWPAFLPDDRAVLFARTDQVDFTGGGVGVSGAVDPAVVAPFSELSLVDVASKTVTLLAKAMGYDTPEDAVNGVTYLPFGEEELRHAFYPTVSPVGAGGYFWVFFDSVRHYGGLGLQRQLWGAAIDISADGTYVVDPSHPAFYLSGQEHGTGNHRAFAALDPCRQDGDACSSGVDCCGGFCHIEQAQELAEPVGTCSPKMQLCSKRDERCVSDADCCATEPGEPTHSCIAGYCTQVRGPD